MYTNINNNIYNNIIIIITLALGLRGFFPPAPQWNITRTPFWRLLTYITLHSESLRCDCSNNNNNNVEYAINLMSRKNT
jgi:hypothetical protein